LLAILQQGPGFDEAPEYKQIMIRILQNYLHGMSWELPDISRWLAERRRLGEILRPWKRGSASLLLARPRELPEPSGDGKVDRVLVVYASDAAGLQENVNGFLRRNKGAQIINIVQSQCLSRTELGAEPFVHVFLTLHYRIAESPSSNEPM
jgi:hypothetical protein